MKKLLLLLFLVTPMLIWAQRERSLRTDKLRVKTEIKLGTKTITDWNNFYNQAGTPGGTLHENDLWYNSSSGLFYVYNGSAWAQVTSAGISDGDKGDITVSGSGLVWTIDAGVITLAMLNFDPLLDSDTVTIVSTHYQRDTAAAAIRAEVAGAGYLTTEVDGDPANEKNLDDHTGTIATAQIEDNAVTLAKQASGTADRLQGFDGSGNPSEITAGANVTISGGVVSATGGPTINASDGYVPKRLNATTFTNSLINESSGNVGIGISSPSAQLQIDTKSSIFQADGKTYIAENIYHDGADFRAIIGAYTTAVGIGHGVNRGLSIFSTGGTTAADSIAPITERFKIGFSDLNFYGLNGGDNTFNTNGSSNHLRIQTTGNFLAVGDISPTATFHVNGNAKIATISNATTDTDKFLVDDGDEIKYRTDSELRSDLDIFGTSGTFTVTAPAQDTIKDLGGTTTGSIGGTFSRIDNLITATVSFLVYTTSGRITTTIAIDPPAGIASNFTSTTDVRLVGGNLISEGETTGLMEARLIRTTADTSNDEVDAKVYFGSGSGPGSWPNNHYECTVTFRYLIQ